MRTVLGLGLVVGGGWLMYRVVLGTSQVAGGQLTPSQVQTANNLACSLGISWLCPPNQTTTSNPPGQQTSKFGPYPT